eukprot:6043073-Prymnesium_polylepis.1
MATRIPVIDEPEVSERNAMARSIAEKNFAQLCKCALDLEIILAHHPEILLRVAGPAELII